MNDNIEKNTCNIYFIAKGSLGEVETYLLLAKNLGYFSEDDYESIEKTRKETGRILIGLIKSLS